MKPFLAERRASASGLVSEMASGAIRTPLARAEAPAGLAGTDLARRFRHWRGVSGRRHLFSVFPLAAGGEDVPRFEDAVILAVKRDAEGGRTILCLDETGSLPDLFFAGRGFRDALARGADEVHVHLLAETAGARATVRRDLEG